MEYPTRRRSVGSVGLATLLAATLAGCYASAAPPVPWDGARATASAVPLAAVEADPSEVVPQLSDLASGTVIATGSFNDRGVTGQINITANGADNGFDVTLTGMQPVPPAGSSLEFNALPAAASDGELQDGFSYYRYDLISQVPDQTFSTPSAGYGGFETNDPRFMRTAVIWVAPQGAPVGLGSVVATAALTWDLPHMGPGPEVDDHGAAEGAHGQAARADDGTPISYRIAAGDTAYGIAARFGITTGDLQWLNPDRFGGRLILADITLNLSRDSRGLR